MSISLISTVTVGAGGAASIDFTSIPGTYTDLMLVYSLRGAGGGGTDWQDCKVQFNGVTTGYSNRGLYGTGSAAGSNTETTITLRAGGPSNTANTFGNGSLYIPNYAGSTQKSVSIDNVGENNGTVAVQFLTAGLSTSTSAISSLSIIPLSGTIVQYSTTSLYGIKSGASGGVTVS